MDKVLTLVQIMESSARIITFFFFLETLPSIKNHKLEHPGGSVG